MKGLRLWLPVKSLVNQDCDLSSSTGLQACVVFVEHLQSLVLKMYYGIPRHDALVMQIKHHVLYQARW